MAEPLLKLEAIAKEQAVHIETVRRWIRDGKLPATIASRQTGYRVSRKDLQAFLAGTLTR